MSRLTNRVGAVEHYLNGLRQDFARFGARHVNVQAEIDALVRRVEAIERRLEISDQT